MRTADEWFLYNCWYAAGWTIEIEQDKPLPEPFWNNLWYIAERQGSTSR